MTQTVEIVMHPGGVQDVRRPPGIRVVIRDDDIQGDGTECAFDIRRDEDGDPYQYIEFPPLHT